MPDGQTGAKTYYPAIMPSSLQVETIITPHLLINGLIVELLLFAVFGAIHVLSHECALSLLSIHLTIIYFMCMNLVKKTKG